MLNNLGLGNDAEVLVFKEEMHLFFLFWPAFNRSAEIFAYVCLPFSRSPKTFNRPDSYIKSYLTSSNSDFVLPTKHTKKNQFPKT